MTNEDVPDKTFEELQDYDEEDPNGLDDDDIEELNEEVDELRLSGQYVTFVAVLADAFRDGEVTLREYHELCDWIDEKAREQGAPMP